MTSTEPLPDPGADPQVQLAHIIPALWRSLKRATTAAQELPALESQVSIIRKLDADGPLAPAQLADSLHLARPTVSNLLKVLVHDGLVVRAPSERDARSVLIDVTDRGRDVLETFRRDRTQVLAEAIAQMNGDDRSRVVQAVSALRELIHTLERIADEETPREERRISA